MKTSPDYLPNLISLLVVAMMGASILTLLPLWVGALSEQGHFTSQEIGWLAAADVMGIFISSASALLWVRRVPWRNVVLGGLLLFFLGNIASLGLTEFGSLMSARIIAGIGCGSAYAIALAGLGDHRSPPLAFGLMVTAQVVFGTIGFFAVPRIMEFAHINGFFHYLNGWLALALALCALAFPRSQKQADTALHRRGLRGLAHGRSLLVFATTVVYYCGVSAVWAYLERIGIHLGLSGSQVGDLLGIGFAISGLGSLATPWLSTRIGRTAAISLAMLVQVATMAWLIGGVGGTAADSAGSYLLYAGATIVFQFFWSFSLPLLMDQFNRVDDSGRFIVLCASAFKVGEIIGPPLAAMLMGEGNVVAVLWLGIACMAVTLAMAATTETRPAARTSSPVGEPC
ncbi:MFS transporter [Microbulbifer sp. SA54]|uniref:MFS transporter n=1 Tax=Microbulbifer sp. SA54 TaxID=3401577 RepID=UPI003AAD1E05